MQDFGDEFVAELQASIREIKSSREIPEELRDRIMSVKDNVALGQLLKYAVQATTISEFDSMMNL